MSASIKPKILFFQRLNVQHIGVTTLAAVLKREGFAVDIVVGDGKRLIERLRNRIEETIVCYTSMTNEYGYIEDIAGRVRQVFGGNITQIIGGPHPTFFPEMIPLNIFDAVCVGEGDNAIVRFVQRKMDGKISPLENIFDKNNDLKKLELAPLLKGDEIPAPDMELYQGKGVLDNEYFGIATGRRCPYKCSYCHNHLSAKLYRGLGKYHAQRPVENVIDEAKSALAAYHVKKFKFFSEVLGLDRRWLREFAESFRSKVGVPFDTFFRADQADEEIIELLSVAGCVSVEIGLETGNEDRRFWLDKKISNKQVHYAVELLKEKDISIATTNMLGLPDETYEQALETIHLNRELKVDHAWFILYVPFPKTDLGDYAFNAGMLEEGFMKKLVRMNPHDRSLLHFEGIQRIEILHKFSYLVLHYDWFEPIATYLSKRPFFSIYFFTYRVSYFFLWYRVIRRQSFREMCRTLYNAVRMRF